MKLYLLTHSNMRKLTFITGPAGSGKTYQLKEMLKREKRPHLICAPTGIAAVGCGGSTIHRTFKFNSDSGLIQRKWYNIQVVYVDEISMVGMKLFEAIVEGAPEADLVVIGDMAQLPPVRDKFWFESDLINQFDVDILKLDIQYRQNDHDLADILNKIRLGIADPKDMKWMYRNSTLKEENEDAITLAYRNDTVRAMNAEALLSLEGESVCFIAGYSGIMKETDCIAESQLVLRPEARVIMLNNDLEGRWHNGTQATVTDVDSDDGITVDIRGNRFLVEKHKWVSKIPSYLSPYRRNELELELKQNLFPEKLLEIKHALETGIEYEVAGSCVQYPMKLAYAMTVHKAQGMTLDNINIIMNGFAGTHGIGYVALSRARHIDGITFSRSPRLTDFKFNKRLMHWL